jgi:hypothetical protein
MDRNESVGICRNLHWVCSRGGISTDLSYKLSSRDLVEMMSERGIALAHTTILRWVQRLRAEFENAGASIPNRSAAEHMREPLLLVLFSLARRCFLNQGNRLL